MDYAKIASQVIANVGGKENIKSVAHCATRLRFQLKNNDLRNEVPDYFWIRTRKSDL